MVAERKLRRAPRRANRTKLQDRVDSARTALTSHARSSSSPEMSVWTPAQIGAFLDSIADDRLHALFHLIAFRDLRRGEAVGLPWINVDLQHGQVVRRRDRAAQGPRPHRGPTRSLKTTLGLLV